MSPLLYKLTLSPLLVGLASLAGRRWGGVAAGLVAGLPIVAAPVLFFYVLEQGPAYADQASINTVLGLLSLSVFLLIYAWRCWGGGSVLSSLGLGWVAFLVLTVLIDRVGQRHAASLLKAVLYALAALYLARRSLPPAPGARQPPGPKAPAAGEAAPGPGAWDLPLRMAAAAALVLFLTAMAHRLGPRLGGLLTPLPVASTVLLVFAHMQEGRAAVRSVVQGLLLGLNAFVAFLIVLALLLPVANAALSFAAAALAAVLVQSCVVALAWRTAAS